MEIDGKLKEASHLNAGFVELTTALGGAYYWGVKQGLPVAVGLPFTSNFSRNRRCREASGDFLCAFGNQGSSAQAG